jgi:transposase-like protein
MSTKTKKVAPTGVRYTDAQKQEVVDFVAKYNSENGRGGQSAAAKKYNITQLTIAAWLKAFGGKAPKAAAAPASKAAAKEAAPAKPSKFDKAKNSRMSVNRKKGMRYSLEQKQEVIDFVTDYNSRNGRGGQSHAAKRFGLSVLTVSSWLKGVGAKTKYSRSASVSPGLSSKFHNLVELGAEIRRLETELQSVRHKYDTVRLSIQAAL